MLLEDYRAITRERRWRAQAALMLSQPGYPAAAVDAFGSYWIESGHHIRAQVGDDSVLARLLRHLLPAYTGPRVELFRGENKAKLEIGSVGFAWTSDKEIARMFGRGLNAVGSGGVLLRSSFEPEQIVSGPNSHSVYLGENQFTVDSSLRMSVEILESYPAMA